MRQVIADMKNARQHWERRSDPLPYLIVPMSDGSTVRYNPEVRQPGFQRAMEGIRRIGYQLKEAGDCWNSQPAGNE